MQTEVQSCFLCEHRKFGVLDGEGPTTAVEEVVNGGEDISVGSHVRRKWFPCDLRSEELKREISFDYIFLAKKPTQRLQHHGVWETVKKKKS